MTDKDLTVLFKVIKHLGKGIAAAGLSLALHSVAHSEPVKVFGVSLGGVLARPFKSCPQIIGSPDVCWHSAPFVTQIGNKLYPVSIPDNDLPEWAANRTTHISLTPRGTVASLGFELENRCAFKRVVSSITTRFGNPTQNSLQSHDSFKAAIWDLRDIYISLQVAGPYCSISFTTPEYRAQQNAHLKSQEVKRPATP